MNNSYSAKRASSVECDHKPGTYHLKFLGEELCAWLTARVTGSGRPLRPEGLYAIMVYGGSLRS